MDNRLYRKLEHKRSRYHAIRLFDWQVTTCLTLACCPWKWSHSVVSDSLWPCGLQPPRLLRPWNSPGKSTGVGCHFLLQWILPTQGSNLGLPHCRQMLHPLSHQRSCCPWLTTNPLLGKTCHQPQPSLGLPKREASLSRLKGAHACRMRNIMLSPGLSGEPISLPVTLQHSAGKT